VLNMLGHVHGRSLCRDAVVLYYPSVE
jgi:hypothetical protein